MLHSDTLPATLIGRDRERAALSACVSAILGGHGQLALVSGEAGIGKSALLRAVAAEAEAAGALLLRGNCYDLAAPAPYSAWLDLFARCRARQPPIAPPNAFRTRADLELIPSQADLFDSVGDCLLSLCRAQPLVLVMEDLHWADSPTLELLRFIAQRDDALPLLLLASYRADELSRDQPLYSALPALLRETQTLRVELAGLPVAATRAIIQTRYPLPDADAERLTAHIQRRADGNPFFIGELLRAFEESGILTLTPAGWALGELASTPTPALVGQVIDRRVRRLGAQAREHLEVIATIGLRAPLALLRAISGAPDDALATELDRAVDARIVAVTEGGDLQFVHALVQEALYGGILPLRRRALHARIGETLALAPQPDADVITHHFQRAGDERAIAWTLRAGEHAQRAYAWLAAAERFDSALALMERAGADPGDQGWLHYRVALLRRVADPDAAIRHLDAAAQLGSAAAQPALTASATLFRGHVRCIVGQLGAGLADIELGVRLLATLTADERVPLQRPELAAVLSDNADYRGILAYWFAMAGRLSEAREVAELVLAHGRPAPATSAIGDAWGTACFGLAAATATLGLPDAACDAYTQARERYRALDHHYMLGLAIEQELHYVLLPYRADDIAGRRRQADDAETALRRGGGAASGRAGVGLAPLLLIEGLWDTADALARATANATYDTRDLAHYVLAWLARERSDPARAWQFVLEALPDGPDTQPSALPLLSTLQQLRLAAMLAVDDADLPAARAWLEAHDRLVDWSGATLGRAEGQLGWAEWQRAAGHADLGRRHATRALAYASAPRQPLALLAAHRMVGELDIEQGQLADAATHLELALRLADDCAAPFERAQTLLALADLHDARGEPDSAGRQRDAAQAICAELGATRVLARRAVPTKRARPEPYPAGLTAREVEVLRLLAQGESNREIASALFLSVRTVERHLSNAYGKIAARNRADATAYAVRRLL